MEGEGPRPFRAHPSLILTALALGALAGSCRLVAGTAAGEKVAAPRVSPSAFFRVEGLLDARRGDEALAEALRFRESMPQMFRAHALVQDAMESLGRLEEVRAQYRARFERTGDPHDAVLLARLLDDPREQLEILDRALLASPWDPWAHFARGAILRRQGRSLEAREHLELATAHGHAPPATWRELAEVREELGEVDAAAAAWRVFLATGEDRPWDRERYAALLLLALGDPQKAARQFTLALQMRPGDLTARKGLAASLLAQGRLEEAVAGFEAILQAFPHDADTLWNLAVAWLDHGNDPVRARAALRRYVEIGGERSWLAKRMIESLPAAGAVQAKEARSERDQG